MNANTIPFTYSVFCVPTGQYYYGVRTAKKCHPDALWITYFTSSKFIKELINTYGKESFVTKIRKTFDSREKALKHEEKFLKRVKAAQSDKWINKSNGAKNFVCNGHTEESRKKMRQRTCSEETRKKLSDASSGASNPMFGKKRIVSEYTKIKLSVSNSGENNGMFGKTHSALTRKRLSEVNTGENSSWYGKHHSLETKQKISSSNKGKIPTEESRKKMSDAQKGEKSSWYGKKHTESSIKLMSQNKSGVNHPLYGKTGEENPSSKKYCITYPDGNKKTIIGLNEFCINNDLSRKCMSLVAAGKNKQHKGYKCEHA